ncbi:MAG TPA: terminase small subunit [Stellaceae bacterium]
MNSQLVAYRESVTLADLTERQAKFVQAYMERGTQRDGAIQAALAAGYGDGDRAQAKSRAYELLHHHKILAALRDEISNKLSAAASIGVGVLIELAQSAGSEQVRLGAARELVDRGHGPIMSRNASGEPRGRTVEDFLAGLTDVTPYAKAEGDADAPRSVNADPEG